MPNAQEIVLPTEVVPVTDHDPKSLLLYGSPKIGKSTILAGLTGNFIFDIEGSTKYLSALKMDISHPTLFNRVMDKVIAEKPYQFTTLDTITKLEEWCEKLATIKYKSRSIGLNFDGDSVLELEYGAGYGLLRNEVMAHLSKFKKTSDRTIIVAHVVDKSITKNRGEVAVKDINLTGKIKSIVSSDVDAVGYIYVDPENNRKRRITFLTSDEITCGNRCPHLEGKDFVISEKLDDNSVVTYWNEIYSSIPQ